MQEDRSFTNADDDRLISLIGAAKSRVVFVAPGLRNEVAQALADAFGRLPGQVSVILDADAEVCRLGYGDEAGMELVTQAAELHGQRILHQPGVRIGLLIADGDTLIYSPAPLLIEAGSTQPEKPNAIMLKGAVPAAIEAACGISAKRDELREVGLEFVKEAKLAEVKADLAASPPKEFNIARIERVFNSAIHFIELEITGYRLKAKKIKLDVELFGMGDSFLRERVENTFKPFDDAAFLTVEIPTLEVRNDLVLEPMERFGPEILEHERQRLKKEYLFDVPGFGVVIRRADKLEFERELRFLEAKLKRYVEVVTEHIVVHLETARGKLKTALIEVVLKTTPGRWKKFAVGGRLDPQEASRLLDDALGHAFAGMVAEFAPAITWNYKDVTYETIHKPGFRKALEKDFGKSGVEKLFSEHDAAPESNSGNPLP